MKHFLLLLLPLFIASSCGEGGAPGPAVPGSPIKGTVITLAECDFTKLDPGGVQITVTDSASGKTVATAVTDPAGAYTVQAVPDGTYNLSFEKEGFGTYKLFSRKHSAAKLDSIRQVQLARQKFGIGKIQAMVVTSDGERLAAGGAMDRPGVCWTTQAVIYFDDEPTVDYNNYKFGIAFDQSSIHYVRLSNIYARGLKPGQTLYYVGYIEQLHSIPYFDPTFGVSIRPNIDFATKTAVFETTLP
jgi:hypothetical protein